MRALAIAMSTTAIRVESLSKRYEIGGARHIASIRIPNKCALGFVPYDRPDPLAELETGRDVPVWSQRPRFSVENENGERFAARLAISRLGEARMKAGRERMRKRLGRTTSETRNRGLKRSG